MTRSSGLGVGAVLVVAASWIAALRILFRHGFLVGDLNGTAFAFLVWPVLCLALGILAMATGKVEKNLWAILSGAAAVVSGSTLLVITALYYWIAAMS